MREHERYFSISLISLGVIVILASLNKVIIADPMKAAVYAAFKNTFSFALTFAMIVAWGISVVRRVMQVAIKKYLLLSAIAMVFWLFIRDIKWHYAKSPLVVSWLWYLYYVPMVLIPLYGFLAARHLGQDDSYKLNPKWYWLYFDAALIIAMVLTNNLHKKVFVLADLSKMDVGEYSYGPGYYVAVAWIVLFTTLFIVISEKRCNQIATGWRKIIPYFILLLGILYAYGYMNMDKLRWFPDIDLMLAFDWFTIMIWESSIELGLITVNSNYLDFFKHSSIGAQITDQNGKPYISAYTALDLPKDVFDALQKNGIYQYDLGIMLHIYPSLCGYTIWQEDVSILNRMIETLKGIQDELKEGNTIAEQEMQAEVRKKKTEETTRLYTLLSRSVEDELSIINGLAREILKSGNLEKIKKMMGRINFEGVYLKRKGNLIMIAENDNLIPAEELELALMEMEKNLELCDMQFSYKLNIDRKLTKEELLALLETIETIVDAKLYRTNATFVQIDSDSQGLNMTVKQPDSKASKFSFAKEGGPNAQIC